MRFGKPLQTGFVERFSGSYRRKFLDLYVCCTGSEVQEHTDRWVHDYNQNIPATIWGDLPPVESRQLHRPETASHAWTKSREVDGAARSR